MNQCFIVVKLIYNISLPSAVPFLPAEHSSRCQHNTLCQRSPNKNRSPKPVFPLRTRTTLSLTTDTRKKTPPSPQTQLSAYKPSQFFVLFFFSQTIPFLPHCQAALSELLSSAVLTQHRFPNPLEK